MERKVLPIPQKRVRKHAPGFGKHKGSEFERTISKALSLWITEGQSKDSILWRTSGSGARATVFRKKSDGAINQLGDVGAIDSKGEAFTNVFVTEAKFYKDLGFICILKEKDSYILQEWAKVRRVAQKVGKNPLMLIKQNHCKTLFCVDPTQKLHIHIQPVMILPTHHMKVYIFEKVTQQSFRSVMGWNGSP